MLDQIIPLPLAALALWSGWTAIRTAVELRSELRRELAVVVVRRVPRAPGNLR